jgi:hypothetical protein
MEVCQRLSLGVETSPPPKEPLKAGSLLEGVPFDPVLASVYARLGHARFAPGCRASRMRGDGSRW